MIVDTDHAAGVVTKRARTEEEAARLRREATTLEAARHPGVTELVALRAEAGGLTSLHLRALEGACLNDVPALSAIEIARLGAVLATTVADLHDLGIVHGLITAEHIVVGADGQPILCGLGARELSGDGEPEPSCDVAALGEVLLSRLADGGGGPLHRALERAAHPDPRRRPTARALAGRLTRLAEKPRRGRPAGQTPARMAAAVTATAAGALAIVLGAFLVPPAAGRPASAGHPRPTCPAVDVGCGPLLRPAGVLRAGATDYRIGQPGDLVVVGRWHCGAALPALLQPIGGGVWVWDSWTVSGGPTAGRLVARVDDALSLQVDPRVSGCDRLLVTRRSGSSVPIQPVRPGR